MTKETIQTPESSNLKEFSYEDEKLTVTFKNGSTYNFFEVPESVFNDMKEAKSRGSHFNKFVKGAFRSEREEKTKDD